MENIYSVLITAITTLGGASAWRYFEKRAEKKEKDERWMQNECQSRITKLETLLETSSKEKDELVPVSGRLRSRLIRHCYWLTACKNPLAGSRSRLAGFFKVCGRWGLLRYGARGSAPAPAYRARRPSGPEPRYPARRGPCWPAGRRPRRWCQLRKRVTGGPPAQRSSQ